ncbi:MAG: 1-acyl-sn-glycerol-3-phosphate acyltransferase [Gammaproteobacteria bacterium]|nr:1-acyl-sn-glycerol-3-phosphate acyltransferase [Gammaproteobacteria bacterium]
MQNFESIRPYRDDEVPVVIQRLAHDPALLNAAAAFFAPRLARWLPWVARYGARRVIQRRTAGLDSVRELQLWLADYMERVIRDSVHELTVDGLEALQPGQPYLFVSNHRDIVMDSALLNYSLHQAGHTTMRVAVGDNLLSEAYAADLMRLNKSFVIERSVSGARALYQAITRTSGYIRHSLEEGQSVWIAQREGRAKDGFDRTDPAVLKMLSLAYRKELDRFGDLLDRVSLIPVSVSYELDPCDRRKAHELFVAEQTGRYVKQPGEDLASIVDGILGFKGRVHVQVSPPLRGDFADPEAMAHALDRAIVGGLRIYPTQVEALRRLGDDCPDSAFAPVPRVMRVLAERIAACPEPERAHLLGGYANPIRNRRTLGVG